MPFGHWFELLDKVRNYTRECHGIGDWHRFLNSSSFCFIIIIIIIESLAYKMLYSQCIMFHYLWYFIFLHKVLSNSFLESCIFTICRLFFFRFWTINIVYCLHLFFWQLIFRSCVVINFVYFTLLTIFSYFF